MLEKIENFIPGFREKYKHLFKQIEVTANTVLLHEGEISQHLFIVKKGCIRAWFNKDGKDITTQFFFEQQAIASFESFYKNIPSIINIETIEPSVILFLSKTNLELLNKEVPELKDCFIEFAVQRFIDYSKLFISRIKDSPRERYLELVKNRPDIVKRVPQHYIASYLGITPVSLSRIKNRK